ncbi:hypothetical protein Cni_G05123 [Canna indica]|uniref:Uncharacterized protein n=1 Tax=Canna indica TaxID=4628 RepID=A0AAQ3JX49_9LILI|nr:hypothetical protein Cni_G05123 [Canna indica]
MSNLSWSASPHPTLVRSLVAVVDLGCSTGTNTLFFVDVIVKYVAQMYEELDHDLPEFLVFFSDLPSNDFNVLFQLLPPPPSSKCLEGQRRYFASGVSGSFYSRLFPSRSVNVFNSSLHWLPQVPRVDRLVHGERVIKPAEPRLHRPDQQGVGIFFGTHFKDVWNDLVQEVVDRGSPLVMSNSEDADEMGWALVNG